MVAAYFDEKKCIDDIAEFCLQIQSWVSCWHTRRGQVFDAFRGPSHEGVNMSEMGNSAWKHGKVQKLIDACLDDICTMVQQATHSTEMKVQDMGRH